MANLQIFTALCIAASLAFIGDSQEVNGIPSVARVAREKTSPVNGAEMVPGMGSYGSLSTVMCQDDEFYDVEDEYDDSDIEISEDDFGYGDDDTDDNYSNEDYGADDDFDAATEEDYEEFEDENLESAGPTSTPAPVAA